MFILSHRLFDRHTTFQDGDTHRIENFFIMRQSRFYNRFSICCLLELSAKPLKGVKKSCF